MRIGTPPLFLRSPSSIFLASITLILSAWSLYDFFFVAYTYVVYPYEIDYGEGCSILFLSQLQTQGTYFFDINNYPFSYATYPPVFMLLGWLVNLFVPSMLMALRLLSVIATCLLLPALFLLIYNRTKQRILSLIFTLSFIGVWFVKLWAPLARVDMLVFLFTVMGLLTFQIWIQDKKRYWAFLFFVLAFFTKQNAILAPLSILLFSLVRKDQRKYFLSYLAAYLVPILSIFLFLDVYTHGEAFKHLVLYTSQRQFSGLVMAKDFLVFFSTFSILLSLASPFRFVKQIWASDDLIYWFYLVLNLLSIPTVAMTGANLNYLIEPVLSMTILGAILSARWCQNTHPPSQNSLRYLVIVAALFVQNLWHVTFSQIDNIGKIYDFALGTANRPHQEKIEQLIRNSSGNVISENLTLMIQNQKPVLLGCSYPLAEQGLWKPARLIEDCKEKRLDLAILEHRIPKILELYVCLDSGYKKIEPSRSNKSNLIVYKL